MIIDFKLKNWGSYKDWETLDFTKKSKEKNGTKFISKKCGKELLNVIGLVGINAGGKSLLLEGLDFMRSMVVSSHNYNIDSKLPPTSFSNNAEKPTEFEINFIEGDQKYSYGFSHNEKKIITEFLKVYDSQKATQIFARNENSRDRFKISAKYKKELEPLSHNVIPQTLMISRGVQLNSKTLKPVFDFFSRIISIQRSFGNQDFSLLKNEKNKKNLLEKLHHADFSIIDLRLFKEKLKHIAVELDKLSMRKKESEKNISTLVLLHKNKKKNLEIKFNYESIGTQRFIWIFYNLLTIKKNSIILFDEIENSFNIDIVLFVINHFAKSKFQLLLTTHQPEILNNLRSDQINIIMKEDSVSKICNLHSIVKDNPKINKNYGDYYREGVLGGFPNVYQEED